MRSWMIVLAALFCLNVNAEEANTSVETVLNSSDTVNEEELVKAAEAISKSDPTFSTTVGKTTESAAKTEENTTTAAATPIPESQIPIYSKGKTIEKASSDPYWRVIATVVVICIFGAAAIFIARKRGFKRNQPGLGARIEVLHQHHFSPKKGLALIRVAGEVMLISMTDQSISMIKPVALIDDEVSGIMGKDFNNFLEDDFTVSSVQNALRAQM
jgi:hypothetical protein